MSRRAKIMATGMAVLAIVGAGLATGRFSPRRDAGRAAAGGIGVVVPDSASADSTTQVPVLCYHYLRGVSNPLRLLRVVGYVVLSLPLLDDSELWTTTAHGFEQEMRYLVSRGYHTVTLEDVDAWQMGLRELPPKPVVLTFDDADESAYTIAYPVLRRYGLRATVFVVTSHVGQRWGSIHCASWDQLREMQQSGVFDVESHTHHMHYKVAVKGGAEPVFLAASRSDASVAGDADWRDAVRRDLVESRRLIREHTGHAPRFLAWPFGFGNPALDRIAADVGFTRTCSLRRRAAQYLDAAPAVSDTDHFEMPRYTITARTSLRAFRAMIEGIYEPDA